MIAQLLFLSMLGHDLEELRPLLENISFSDIEKAQARFRVLGLPMLAYVRGSAKKS